MGPWIIDGFIINDERISKRTDFQEPIPVAARTSQTRHFQAQDSSHMAQTNFSDQPLEAISADRRRSRLSLILINHLDLCSCPSQIGSASDQVILTGGAAYVLSNLQQGRLPHIDDSDSVKMVRTEFENWRHGEHHPSPFHKTLRDYEQEQHSTLTELTVRWYEYADQSGACPRCGQFSPAHHQPMGTQPCVNLLEEHTTYERYRVLSYLMYFLWRWLLLLNPLSYLPESFDRKPRGFHHRSIVCRWACVVRQACGNSSMTAVRHANDEIRVSPSANANDLDTLAMQGMVGMGHRYPFQRWLVKGGSVL